MFDELSEEELQCSGLGLGGAILGALCGWTLGLPVALINGICNPKASYEDTMNICNTMATVGFTYGLFTPTP